MKRETVINIENWGIPTRLQRAILYQLGKLHLFFNVNKKKPWFTAKIKSFQVRELLDLEKTGFISITNVNSVAQQQKNKIILCVAEVEDIGTHMYVVLSDRGIKFTDCWITGNWIRFMTVLSITKGINI